MIKLSILLTLIPFLLLAEQPQTEEVPLTEKEWMAKFEKEIDRRTGEIALLNGKVKLNVPNEFYYLDAEDTKRVLEEAWGNPPSKSSLLGMLFPLKHSPLDLDAWGVTIDYSDDGYVNDAGESELDYGKIFKTMKKEAKKSNKARKKKGYGKIQLLGWAEPPIYDNAGKKLYWGNYKKLERTGENILDYNLRILGKEGYLIMNFVASIDQLNQVKEARPTILEMANFSEGNTYAEHKPGIDKTAEYNVSGLVAGKVVEKSGILIKLLLLIKKFWVVPAIALTVVITKAMKRAKNA